jgi:hypothetical protein
MKENNSEIEEKKLYNRIQNLIYKKIDALRDSKEYVKGYLEQRDLLYELLDKIENLTGANKEDFDSNKCFICGGTGNIDEYRKNFNCAICKGEFNTEESPFCFICKGCMTAEEDESNYYISNKLKEALRLLDFVLISACLLSGLDKALTLTAVRQAIFYLDYFQSGINFQFNAAQNFFEFKKNNYKEYENYLETMEKMYGGRFIK